MKIHDISWPISQATTGYKDKKIIQFEELKYFAVDNVRETAVTLSSHSGTHVDAPSHFLHDGKTIDELHLDRVVGNCVVLDLTAIPEKITRNELLDCDIQLGDIVLLKTSNSFKSPTEKFFADFIYVEASAAQYLCEKKVKAVGIDYLGIERSQLDHITHKTLMHADIIIIEGLRLLPIAAGRYFFVCLPLNIIGLEAAPARAILIEK